MVKFPPLREGDSEHTYQVPCWAIAPATSEVDDIRPLSYVIGAPSGFKKLFRGTVIRVHRKEGEEVEGSNIISADVMFHDFDFFPNVPASRLSLRNVNEEAARNISNIRLELCKDEMADLAIRLQDARQGKPDLDCQLVGQDQRGTEKRKRHKCSRCDSVDHCIRSCPRKDTSSVLRNFKFNPPLSKRRVPTIDELATLNSCLPRLITISWVICDTCKIWRKDAPPLNCLSDTFVCADLHLDCSIPRDLDEVTATDQELNSYPLRLRRQFDEGEQSDDSEAYDNVDGGAEGYTEDDAEGVPGFPNSNGEDEIDDDYAPFWRNEDHGEVGHGKVGAGGGGGAVGEDAMQVVAESPFEDSSDSDSSIEEGVGRTGAASKKTSKHIK